MSEVGWFEAQSKCAGVEHEYCELRSLTRRPSPQSIDSMESRTPSNGGASGGASRTFQSLFGERDEQKQSRSVATDPSCLSREDQDDDDDVWDDDFPSDVNMESAEEDDAGHLKSTEVDHVRSNSLDRVFSHFSIML